MSRTPSPEALRQRLLAALAESSEAMTTAELRRCLSTTFGDVVHEQIYHNLQVLEKRGEVTHADTVGRHTKWRLAPAHKRAHHRRLSS
jgi:Fe2+ or Zn2+ uptake regulation protein